MSPNQYQAMVFYLTLSVLFFIVTTMVTAY